MKIYSRQSFIAAFAVMISLATVQFANAALIVNPPIPIQYRVTINPIVVSNTNGSNTAEFFGTAAQEAEIKSFVDIIWSQAGIDVEWQDVEFWDDTFVNTGDPLNNNPRPTSDLSTIRNMANIAGLNDPDPTVINMYFVEIAAGFPDVGENTVNGLAFVDGNGITQHVGDNLPGFLSGREAVASVVAHEIGHNLGLPHIVEAENLMQAGGSPNQGERINAAQILTVQGSEFAVFIPEPGSLTLLMGLAVIVGVQRRRND